MVVASVGSAVVVFVVNFLLGNVGLAFSSPVTPLIIKGYGSRHNLLDLGYDHAEDTPFWPGSGTKFEINNRIEGPNARGIWYSSQSFCTAEHSGTHLDAPVHFASGGWSVDQIPIDRLVAPAMVINITGKAADGADAQLTANDVMAWEQTYGQIPEGSVVVMYSGWGQYWSNHSAYFGNDRGDVTAFHFPGVHPEAAQWLVANRSIVGIGVDTPSLDYGASVDFLTHRILSEANAYGLENVANLDKMPPSGAILHILPMKIRGGTGAPCRIIANLSASQSALSLNTPSVIVSTLLALFILVISK